MSPNKAAAPSGPYIFQPHASRVIIKLTRNCSCICASVSEDFARFDYLRADMVGSCELPSYAVYTHGKHDGNPVELNHKHAIGILIDQDWRTTSAFNGHDWISNSMSFLSYSTSALSPASWPITSGAWDTRPDPITP